MKRIRALIVSILVFSLILSFSSFATQQKPVMAQGKRTARHINNRNQPVPSQTNTPKVSSAPDKAKPCLTKVFDVNSFVDTGIAINVGDKITIRASGLVRFGDWAGEGGPQGVLFNPGFNHIQQLRHGCLIGRVRELEHKDDREYLYHAAEDEATVKRRLDAELASIDKNDKDADIQADFAEEMAEEALKDYSYLGNEFSGWAYIGRDVEATSEVSGILQLDVNDIDPANNKGKFQVEVTICSSHSGSRSTTSASPPSQSNDDRTASGAYDPETIFRQRTQAIADAQSKQAEAVRQQRAQQEAERRRQIEAAAGAGKPEAKLQVGIATRREEEDRQRWSSKRLSPAAYEPQWMGQTVSITGTVSRVAVKPTGSPHWVTIFFKESPEALFVLCSPYPEIFQEKVGQDLSALVGKTIEVAGPVEGSMCGGKTASIRIIESNQLRVRGQRRP